MRHWKRRAGGLATAAALAALACACATRGGGELPLAATDAGAPAPVADHDWFYHADDGQARLVFGVQDSDDVQMGLECAAGSGQLDVFAVVEDAGEIHLESGGETERFAAVSEPSELHDGHILSARASADAPVFKRFRRVGWLAALHNGRRDLYVAHPDNAPSIDVFFQTCG